MAGTSALSVSIASRQCRFATATSPSFWAACSRESNAGLPESKRRSRTGPPLGPSCRERVVERLADFGSPPAPKRLEVTQNLGVRCRALRPHCPCQRVVMIHDPDDPRLQRYLVPVQSERVTGT